MHIAHVQATFSPEHGGPTKSLSNYCRSQIIGGHRVSVWTLEGFPDASDAIRLPPPVEMHICHVNRPVRLGRSPSLRRDLINSDTADVYHLHGAWLRALQYGANEAMCRKRPYLLELMGTFEPWSLRQKWPQKRIARWWFQDRSIRHATCLHVNSHQEAEHVRKLGFRNPIAVIPVGVDIDEVATQLAQLPNHAPWLDLDGHPYILFLSRLHPKKRLDLLIRSWSKLTRDYPGWRLVIAGTGNQTYVDECHEVADHLEISDKCFWTGHVDDLQKSWLFAHAQCYVLPTSSENFGNVVAESLAHKTPVITTHHTPWTELPKQKCGWLVADSETDLRLALTEAMSMSPATRQAMGNNGEDLVRRHYSLEAVCDNILRVYEWMVNGRTKPDCVLD